jgi:acyl carrier protein
MIDAENFLSLLSKYTKSDSVRMEDVLFGSGLNLSSIGFTECIMELEEDYDIEIDIDDLDASIKTVGQLFKRLNAVL